MDLDDLPDSSIGDKIKSELDFEIMDELTEDIAVLKTTRESGYLPKYTWRDRISDWFGRYFNG